MLLDAPRPPVARRRHPDSGARSLQLPDLHSVSREDRDQYTLPLAVVSDVGRAGHAGNHLHFLSGLVALHGRVAPARDEHPTPGHLDAVEPPRALADPTRRVVARLLLHH